MAIVRVSMIKILVLQGKGLQSYWPSNFENDLTLVGVEPKPTGLTKAGAKWQTFFPDFQL